MLMKTHIFALLFMTCVHAAPPPQNSFDEPVFERIFDNKNFQITTKDKKYCSKITIRIL